MANNPELLTRPLAEDGDKATIPDTTDGSTGIFSQQYGFQSINSLPLQAGGKAVRREDFNGAFNLLGGIAFYAQKGFTFNFDTTQDYYAGCVVIDTTDGKRYECIADVAAGGSVPSADSTHWKEFGDVSNKANITLDNLAAYHRDVITTSGTYTAPATALYKITVKGAGGGGGGGASNSVYFGGIGGGEGGTTLAIVKMNAGDTATVVIGAGGAGGIAATGVNAGGAGGKGGDTNVTIGNNSYTGGGGHGGAYDALGGAGGDGTILGCAGVIGATVNPVGNIAAFGGIGGGAGGAVIYGMTEGRAGAGGRGGHVNVQGPQGGLSGGDGYVWFEYFA